MGSLASKCLLGKVGMETHYRSFCHEVKLGLHDQISSLTKVVQKEVCFVAYLHATEIFFNSKQIIRIRVGGGFIWIVVFGCVFRAVLVCRSLRIGSLPWQLPPCAAVQARERTASQCAVCSRDVGGWRGQRADITRLHCYSDAGSGDTESCR